MLKKKALYFYNNGFNCSQCIIKACESVYNIPISRQAIKMCSTVNNGFGVGGMCSVLIAGIMVFGILFDEDIAKSKRIKFLSEFQEKHKDINCAQLKSERKHGSRCEELIGEVSDLIEKIVKEKV